MTPSNDDAKAAAPRMAPHDADSDAVRRAASGAESGARKVERRGGARAGAGRPSLSPNETTHVVKVRLTTSQHAKVLSLGGAKWVREQIRNA